MIRYAAGFMRWMVMASMAVMLLACSTDSRHRGQTAPASSAVSKTASPQALLAQVSQVSAAEVRPYWTVDFGRFQRTEGGYSVLVPEAGSEALLDELREGLPEGYVAFIGTTRNLTEPHGSQVELVVAKGDNQFDIIRLAASDGINHGLDTEDIVDELIAWDADFGIDIRQAETDTIQMRMRDVPDDMPAFAQRVYAFCPDIVDQGVGSVEALATALEESQVIYLWWD